ncbi:TPA: hypothetical protein LA827_003169 [Clostridium botulinum]|nr:hypothetical protein [Clostridium botulinum]
MENYSDELKEIKEKINEKVKLIKIEFKGIKGDEKLINISKILKEYCSNKSSVPDVEQYYLFDFDRIEDEINVYSNTNDKRIANLKENEKNRSIYGEYKKFIDSMKKIDKALREEYVIDSLQGVSLVYKEELYGIENLSKRIQIESAQLKVNDLKNMLSYCASCLKTTIFNELAQRGDIIGRVEDVRKVVDKKIEEISNFNSTIESVGLKYDYVFDISKEMLTDKVIIKNLKRKISDDHIKNMIDKYYFLYNKSIDKN